MSKDGWKWKLKNPNGYYAEKGNIVNFGIKPTSPETGHVYIETQNPLELDKGKASQIGIYIFDTSYILLKSLLFAYYKLV